MATLPEEISSTIAYETPQLSVCPRFNSLAEMLDFAALGDEAFNFYNGRGELDEVLTYSQLRSQAQILACQLLELEVERGDCVAIVAETDPLFLRFFFACQYAGLLPVALPASVQLGGRAAYCEQIRKLIVNCDAVIAVGPDSHLDLLLEATVGMGLRKVGSSASFDFLTYRYERELVPSTAHALAYLQYTSGSTSFPRGVQVTQAGAIKNLEEICTYGLKVTAEDRFVSWLPFYHDMGLVGFILTPLASQTSCDFLSPRSFAARPRLWLKLLSENKGTISSSPPFGYSLCTKRLTVSDANKYDLSHWRAAGVGADRIMPEPLRAFAAALSGSGFNPRAFLACYGMAECALAVSFAPLDTELRVETICKHSMTKYGLAMPGSGEELLDVVDCGELLPSYEMQIRDEEGGLRPNRVCGRIFLRGPSVMTGYFKDAEATQAVLSDDGWLDTGDIGYAVDNRLVVTARHKDLIIVNGRNIWPQDIEQIAESVAGVRLGGVAAFSVPGCETGDRLVVVAEARCQGKNASALLAADIKAKVSNSFGVRAEVQILRPRSLARTSSGKLSRYRVRLDFLKSRIADGFTLLPESN